jgi:hypothetical protein
MQPKAEEEPLYLEMCKELLEKIEWLLNFAKNDGNFQPHFCFLCFWA